MRGRVVGISLLLAVAGIGGWFWWSRGRTEVPKYRTEAVARGDVEVLISSTGTLEATETVEVGSQVSGTLATVLLGGTGASTTEPAATRAQWPTSMLPSTLEPAPINTPWRIFG